MPSSGLHRAAVVTAAAFTPLALAALAPSALALGQGRAHPIVTATPVVAVVPPVAARPAARAAHAVVRPRRASRSLMRTPLEPRALGRLLAAARGWSGAEWRCLDRLWERESRWSVTAENPSSGAYGIPQALPGERLAAAGPGWRTDAAVQVRWGLDYIAHRYGDPCAAWAHSRADGFY